MRGQTFSELICLVFFIDPSPQSSARASSVTAPGVTLPPTSLWSCCALGLRSRRGSTTCIHAGVPSPSLESSPGGRGSLLIGFCDSLPGRGSRLISFCDALSWARNNYKPDKNLVIRHLSLVICWKFVISCRLTDTTCQGPFKQAGGIGFRQLKPQDRPATGLGYPGFIGSG